MSVYKEHRVSICLMTISSLWATFLTLSSSFHHPSKAWLLDKLTSLSFCCNFSYFSQQAVYSVSFSTVCWVCTKSFHRVTVLGSLSHIVVVSRIFAWIFLLHHLIFMVRISLEDSSSLWISLSQVDISSVCISTWATTGCCSFRFWMASWSWLFLIFFLKGFCLSNCMLYHRVPFCLLPHFQNSYILPKFA